MKKYKVDPRTKLVIVLIISTLALIYDDLLMLSIMLITSVFIAFLMRSNLVSILIRLKKVIGVFIAIAIIQSIFTRVGNPILKAGGITLITDYGIYKSLELVLRLGVIISSSAILTTSSSREIVQALVQLYIPYEIAFMVSIAIRFLPIFMEELSDTIISIQLRGIDLKRVKNRDKFKIYRFIFLPIITNSLLKAKELSVAMEMRGFRAYQERTSYNILVMNRLDYTIICICLICVTMLIIII